jgi:alpha-mannosidase
VVTSALKPGPDGSAILRVYEAGGKSVDGVKITFSAAPVAAYDANLIEQAGAKLDVSDGLRFNLRAYEIKTFKLQFGRPQWPFFAHGNNSLCERKATRRAVHFTE